MPVTELDHLVLTVRSIKMTCEFYSSVLGMEPVQYAAGRWGLLFGRRKINLHEAGSEATPHAARPVPGSGDLCFLTDVPLREFVGQVSAKQVQIIEGPVKRQGAAGPLLSVYFRDPDGNLIEVANQLTTPDKTQSHAA